MRIVKAEKTLFAQNEVSVVKSGTAPTSSGSYGVKRTFGQAPGFPIVHEQNNVFWQSVFAQLVKEWASVTSTPRAALWHTSQWANLYPEHAGQDLGDQAPCLTVNDVDFSQRSLLICGKERARKIIVRATASWDFSLAPALEVRSSWLDQRCTSADLGWDRTIPNSLAMTPPEDAAAWRQERKKC